MELAKQTILRYRSEGHVRFQIPEALCRPATASQLTAGLHRLEGVYRVDLSPGQRKLSIRFIEHICDFQTVGRELYRLVNGAATEEAAAAAQPLRESLPAAVQHRLSRLHPIRWFRSKIQEARETATAMRILVRRQTVQQKALALLDEDTIIHYLNDVLLIFLIKLHWTRIRYQWIKQPWLHRYEWLAASYMIYLLVRSRRPKN